MVDDASEIEMLVAARPAGFVQLVYVRFGTALQYVGLVAVFQLLWLCLLATVALALLEPGHQTQQRQQSVTALHAPKKIGTHTGVRPKSICGGFPLLMLSRSSSTMSWVMSTCMACTGGGLSPMSPFGAPTRAMPPSGSTVIVMFGVLAYRPKEEAERGLEFAPGNAVKGSTAWREHPGTV